MAASSSSRRTSRCRAHGRRPRPTWWSRSTSAARSRKTRATSMAQARDLGAPTGSARRRYHRRMGRKTGVLPHLRCARDLPRRAAASVAHPESLVQQPGLLQCRHRRETAVLRMLHPQGRGLDGVDSRLVSQRGDDFQRRLRLGRQSVGPALAAARNFPRAAPPRGRSPS